MLNKIKGWIALRTIRICGPRTENLRRLIIKRLKEECVLREYNWFTCTYVERTFGQLAVYWYQVELTSYTGWLECVPQNTSIPFLYIADETGCTIQEERKMFVNYLELKYNV